MKRLRFSPAFASPLLLSLAALALPAQGQGSAHAAAKAAPNAAPARVSCTAAATHTALNAQTRAVGEPPYAVSSKDQCSALLSVFERLLKGKRAAGRKLEGDKPLDLAAAQRQRQAALADPEFRQQLAALQAGETDPLRQQLLEAALLDEEGHYQARDLVLQGLADKLGIKP